MPEPNKRKQYVKLLTVFSSIGLTFASSIFVGFGIGYLIDTKLFGGRTSPWFMFIFLGVGVAAGFKNLYQLARRRDL